MFLRTESFKQYIKLYPITTGIIAINLIVFGIISIVGSTENIQTLYEFGAMITSPDAEAWRYVAAIFIHSGFGHLFFNCFALFVFAPPLERILGKTRYLVLYLLSGIAGNIASVWLHSEVVIAAGASGAIYGIYGAYLFLAIFRKDFFHHQIKQMIITIIVAGFIFSVITPNVDLYGHLGGFIGGIIVLSIMVLFIKSKYHKRSH
jgi:rhomboid protease GluP